MAAVGACVVQREFHGVRECGGLPRETRLGQRGPLPTFLPAVTHTQAPCQTCDPALLFQRGLGTCREKSSYIHFVGICDLFLRPKNLGS